MPAPEHSFDVVADDLFDWMETEVGYYTEALQGPGQRAPFSAATSEKDKKEYFSRMMFKTNPDGSIQYDQPNPEGRDRLLKSYGTRAYADIWNAVRPKNGQGRQEAPEADFDPIEAEMPPMPEDEEPVPTA